MVVVSSQCVFPVPFGIVVVTPVFPIFFLFFFRLGLGSKQLRTETGLAQRLKQQFLIIMVEATMRVVYPAFIAVYGSLSPKGKSFLVVLLPVIKLVMQNAGMGVVRSGRLHRWDHSFFS